MATSQKRQRNRMSTAGRAVVERLIAQGEISLNLPDDRDQVRYGLGHTGITADDLRHASETALITLSGQASVEYAEGTGSPDPRSRRRRRAHAVLRKVLPADDTADVLVNTLHETAHFQVARYWAVIQLVTEHLANQPQLAGDALRTVVDDVLTRKRQADCYGLATGAVVCQVMGLEVQWVSVGTAADGAAALLDGEYGTAKPHSPVLRRILQARKKVIMDPGFREQQLPLLTKLQDVARRVDLARASKADLAAAWWELERAIDRTCGPIDPSVSAELLELDELGAIDSWLGELAVERSTGLTISNRAGQALVLQQLARTSTSSDDAVRRLREARARAARLVDVYWSAIQVVGANLYRQGQLTGDEVRTLIAQAMPDAERPSA